MTSTTKYYKIRRKAIVEALGGECQICGSSNRLEFHHNAEDDQGRSHGIGGWQQLYRLEHEIATGHDIWLVCRECHKAIHQNGGVI